MAADALSEIVLSPGELHFGQAPCRIRTLLGSCIAITLWHPQHKLGGMCHFMLPQRIARVDETLDGRYADEAMEIFMQEIRRCGTRSAEYQAKVFGGGNMFPSIYNAASNINIGLRNVDAARQLLNRYGFQPVSEDLSGNGHRLLMFDLANGDVWLKRTPSTPPRET